MASGNVEEPITSPDAATEIAVPETVIAAPPAERTVPATLTLPSL